MLSTHTQQLKWVWLRGEHLVRKKPDQPDRMLRHEYAPQVNNGLEGERNSCKSLNLRAHALRSN